MRSLPEVDVLVLKALSKAATPTPIRALAEALERDQSIVTAVCMNRAGEGLVEISEDVEIELRLGPKGRHLEGKLPEREVLRALHEQKRPLEIAEVPEYSSLDKKSVGQCLRWLQSKGWVRKEGRFLRLETSGEAAVGQSGADEQLIDLLHRSALEGVVGISERQLRSEGIALDVARELLAGRSGVVEERRRVHRKACLTDAGRELVDGGLEVRRQVNQLTSELLLNGGWRDVDLRPYDVALSSEPRYPGKEHPMVTILQQTRRVFLEMGFSELVSPYVESSFWDFDALFQPQDHPARDMQDTFYIARPDRCQLPDAERVEAVRRTHEDGGATGSVGWRYKWDAALAARPVLRTHTTATSIRALAADPKPPQKVFCVGPVFRRETVDYKHLPVFHQVDGIVVDEHASLATLLGTLKAFYTKMGFERFQFRPGFFPYTEPSVEVFVWSEKNKDWIEMGGSGIFRPEVTVPFGCNSRVLAWGLGLERVAFFRYGLTNIAELYRSRLGWLKETPLCR